MAWRVAESLETLRKQLNEAFPKRSKASDGGIGDAAHASRSSDHNPWVKVGKTGIVTARDFTHDPQTGIDCQWLADTLVANKDPRIKYLIWNKQICSSEKSPWQWRPYSGVNAHRHHLHISVSSDPKLFDSTKPWKLDFPKNGKSDIAKISAAGADKGGDSANSTSNPNDGITQNPINPDPTPVVVEKEKEIGFFRSTWKEITGWTIFQGGLQTLNSYKEQIDSFGLPGWIIAYLIIGAAIAFGIWFLYRVTNYFIVEPLRKRWLTTSLVKANSTPTNTVIVACEEDLAKFAEMGYKVVRRQQEVPPEVVQPPPETPEDT